jgi:DNA-binding transcriptional LysR family regulator
MAYVTSLRIWGVGFVADFEFVAHTNLKRIPIDDTEIETKYYLAYHKERAQSILVRSFCDTAISIV